MRAPLTMESILQTPTRKLFGHEGEPRPQSVETVRRVDRRQLHQMLHSPDFRPRKGLKTAFGEPLRQDAILQSPGVWRDKPLLVPPETFHGIHLKERVLHAEDTVARQLWPLADEDVEAAAKDLERETEKEMLAKLAMEQMRMMREKQSHLEQQMADLRQSLESLHGTVSSYVVHHTMEDKSTSTVE